MTGRNFEAMSAEQIADAIMFNGDPEQVAPLFAELGHLKAGVMTQVVDQLENTAIFDIRRNAAMVSLSRMITELTGQPLDLSRLVNEESLRHTQASTQVYMNVAVIKGEAAHPLVKAYAQEVSRLSADEYHSPALLLAAERAVVSLSSGPTAEPQPQAPVIKPKKGPRRFEI